MSEEKVEKVEKVTVTFQNAEGKAIVCNIDFFEDSQELDMDIDFSDNRDLEAKDHNGLYVALVQSFVEIFQPKTK